MIKDILILVLSGDLLILFYTGAWYDPNKLIERLELFALWALCGWMTMSILKRFWRLAKNDRKEEQRR